MSPTPEPLTDERLAAIEARCAAATPGPWHRRTVGHHDADDILAQVAKALAFNANTDATWVETGPTADDVNVAFVGNGPRQTQNGDFIAAANPATVAALVAEVRRLQELVDDDAPEAWTRGYYAGRLAGWDLANTGTPRSAILTGEDAEGDPPA